MMNKQQNNNLTLIQFMLRAQQIARQDGRSDQGYAMVVVSIVTLLLFSLIGMYLTLTNMSTASTSAYVDGTNTFYTAESGLNRRAEVLRQKFIGYSLPTGLSPGQTAANTFVPPTNVANCFALTPTTSATVRGSGDFSCQNFAYGHTDNSSATVQKLASGKVETTNLGKATNYNAYTFVTDVTNYAPGTVPLAPNPIVIPPGRQYAGLNAMEYRYTVYSTAAKQNNAGTPIDQADARTVLQMNFTSRIVPLFQFAVFYDGDLEMNSSSDMTIGGRVHTNANFYVQPNTATAAVRTTFLSPITAVGSIYNRLDSTGTTWHFPSTLMLMTGVDCTPTGGTCLPFPTYDAAVTVPLTQPQLNAFGNRVQSGTFNQQIRRLDTPPPGFLRKRNYFESSTKANAGEYYAKADMRLEMVPDRDVTSTAAIPWTRRTDIIPFNFTSITTSASASTCSTTLPPTDASTTGVPTLTSDPAADYVDPERNNITALRCRKFTKGQLQSLRQPVMVLTNFDQPNVGQPNVGLRTNPGDVPTATSERALLLNPRAGVAPAVLPVSTTLISALDPAMTPDTKKKILRALQVAIVSNPTPIDLGDLNTSINSASLATVKATFKKLLEDLGPIISGEDVKTLIGDKATVVTPNQIAALQGAWFLPAPIQRVEKTNTDAALNAAPTGGAPGFASDTTNRNFRSSGFHDGRERRWITMLQTNIASLSVWNRDGLYVEAIDDTTDLLRNQPYVASTALKQAAFNSGAGANFTDGFAFDRATATMIAAATPAVIPQGLQTLGLGSIENTEGGLVFHATVSDDLNGDGVMNASDVSLDIANPIKKTDAVGNLVGSNNLPVAPGNAEVIIDYPRKYRGSANFKSPFGFAFNGGNYLPGALTLVTDQAIYTQGDFNNNGAAQPNTNNAATIAANPPSLTRLPASVIGDTITILSNQCLNIAATSTPSATNHLGVPVGQLNCGLPSISNGSVNVTVGGNTAGNWYPVTGPTAVNAAFLSNIDRSNGNQGAGRSRPGGSRFSGAINNYIRMVEGWGTGGQQFNYTGSFVSLGTPLEYSGAYAGTDTSGNFINNSYYQIPSRNFKFDTKFNTFNLLPPLPPRAIYLEQDVFKRNFN
jgi:Tfp pilus assembly protein PilX